MSGRTASRVFVVRRSPVTRSLTALAAAALVSGALAGCVASPFGDPCGDAYRPGDASATVTATGPIGAKPAVRFPTPLIATTPELSVVQSGEGPRIEGTAAVSVEYTLYDASNGSVLQATGYSGSASRGIVNAGDGRPVLADALVCAQPGSRLAVVFPAEALDATFSAETELSGTTYVLVLDVVDTWLGQANGFNVLPQDGMPTVVTAVDGTPGITVGTLDIPAESRTAAVKAGGGATVAEGDVAVLHVRSWSWTGTSVSVGSIDTWEGHTPGRLEADPSLGDPANIPAEVYSALVGATVGSQLIVVVPAADGGSATVFVVDVLGIDSDA